MCRHLQRVKAVVVGETAYISVANAYGYTYKCLAVLVGHIARHPPCSVVASLTVFLYHVDYLSFHGVVKGLVGKKVCHGLVYGGFLQFSRDVVVAYVVVGKHKLIVCGLFYFFKQGRQRLPIEFHGDALRHCR